VEGRHPSNEGRKPGPVPWGLPPSGPASVPPRGRASRALPHGKEASPEGESESAGRGAPKEGRGPKGSTGEGTPRRDPGGPAGRSRPNGRARSGLLDQPQPSPGWEMGRGARGSPRDGHRRNRGEAPRPLARGVGAAAKGPAGPQAVESPGLRDALIPKGPPLSPPPTGGGFRFVPQGLCTGPVRRRAHSRRAPGKGTPPHGRWGGVGAWGPPAQGEVRMVP
jgi:hypothetical protein